MDDQIAIKVPAYIPDSCPPCIVSLDVQHDTRCTDERQWVVFKEVRDSVLHVLQMPLSVQHLLCHGQRITAALREKRPMRPRQAVKLHRLIVRLG